MKFLIDANLPAQLASVFVDAGHECTHVETILPRYSPDAPIARIANETGAVVVSRDHDYVQFSRDGNADCPVDLGAFGQYASRSIGFRHPE